METMSQDTHLNFERETSEVRNKEAHSNKGSLFAFMRYKQVPSGDENVASGAKGRVNNAGLLTSKEVDVGNIEAKCQALEAVDISSALLEDPSVYCTLARVVC